MQFASSLDSQVHVILATQPHEPYVHHRYTALRKALPVEARLFHYTEAIEQNPEAPGFWDMWHNIYKSCGWKEGDKIVASEVYGQKLADYFGGTFYPYDIARQILPAKATKIRENPRDYFEDILPEFQPELIRRVTVFGCESTGKTTLSKMLAVSMKGHWIPEWAREYLETCGTEINTNSMRMIWKGQDALQRHTRTFRDKPFIFQDTDLFSTVGYWDFWNGETPAQLVRDASAQKSDLYLITQSNIPFEPDPLRYGGDKRESDDAFWIALAEKHELNYRIIKSDTPMGRLQEAMQILDEFYDSSVELAYEREFNA